MTNPKFSVLLPTHNRLDLLTRAITTVRQQDYTNWEIIVSDNDSEDGIEDYINSLNDSRIKYVATDQFVPVTDNWNNALKHSDGDYVIMLGDDDGLLNGYFSILCKLIEKHGFPDFVYTGALLYAYPNVIPNCEQGFLKSYKNRSIYQNQTNEFLLESEIARQYVLDSMNFKVEFDYNMQFSLVSKKLINKLKVYGDFYQSPYPDYYASNVIMWCAERILVVPANLVVVGISPKSFGFYYFNNAEEAGNKFLNNLPSEEMVETLKKTILPGPVMNTSWLMSMETLARNLSATMSLKPNYDRYRLLQICAVFADLINKKRDAEPAYLELKSLLTEKEWREYGEPLFLKTVETPEVDRTAVAQKVLQSTGSHPAVAMPNIKGDFSTILDVFQQVKPINNL
ncbi:glycosyltransferase family 2 protein [Paraglaciecola arctica]|uniref:glycosyltransferase family 2 protein n=1 Tax=Paraglaciecola arctica TaxID=1128911 RepID=UPI001C06AD17|nr:glycosyltransferase family 2 protein [Paraglaciecola arctica]MBU3002085.1 glycosyltransferase [Paraglaciecola arctica]